MAVRNTATLKKKLGDILVEVGIINQDQLKKALEVQRTTGGKLGDILKDLKFCSEDVLLAFLGRQCGVSYISLEEYGDIASEVISLVPETVVRHQTLIPISREGNVLTIAMSDPLNVFAIDDLKLMTGCEIKVVIASEAEIKHAIQRHYVDAPSQNGHRPSVDETPKKKDYIPEQAPRQSAQPPPKETQNVSMQEIVANLDTSGFDVPEDDGKANITKQTVHTVTVDGDEAPVIRMVNLILANAVKMRASDIHVEPSDSEIRVRYRLDGVLQKQPAPPKKFSNHIVSRIKVMAQLDVTERRLPQDGRIKIRMDNKDISFRVSTIPVPYGEKVVLRVLDSAGLKIDLTQLGYEEAMLERYKKLIRSPHGMILVTGPTGSGKTTTLYSTLTALNSPEKNILTVEDPIEYSLEGVNQVQVHPEIGLTFAAGLRAFLRQDPNIILVGEIRDSETAEIAIKAALTGHLVLSTLHTNDASGAITRLDNMNVEPFLISSTVIAVIAQRLLRVICQNCKESYQAPLEHLVSVGVDSQALRSMLRGKAVTLKRGKGCETCSNTGYRGRLAVYELLVMTDEIRSLILGHASAHKIKLMAREQGLITLREAAIHKMLEGTTTIEEVIRVTQQDIEQPEEEEEDE